MSYKETIDEHLDIFQADIKEKAIIAIKNIMRDYNEENEFDHYVLAVYADGTEYICTESSFGNASDDIFTSYGKKIKKHTDVFSRIKKHVISDQDKEDLEVSLERIITTAFGVDVLVFIDSGMWSGIRVEVVRMSDIDETKSQVFEYLNSYEEGILKSDKDHEHVITVYRDKSCKMAWVTIDDVCIKGGNNWDFHNGCNGCKIPTYNSVYGYVSVIKRGMIRDGFKVKVADEVEASWYDYIN